MRKMFKKKKSTQAYNKYSISNEFDTKRFSFFCIQSWYHTNRCRISKTFSLCHKFQLDRPKILVIAANLLRFFKQFFLFIFNIFTPKRTLICHHHDCYSCKHVYHHFYRSSELFRRKVRIIYFSSSPGSAYQISAPLNFAFFIY